jgi:hypothetical protein
LKTDSNIGPSFGVALNVGPESLVEAKKVCFNYKTNSLCSIQRLGGLKERDCIQDEVCSRILGLVAHTWGQAVDATEEVIVDLMKRGASDVVESLVELEGWFGFLLLEKISCVLVQL